MTISDIHLECRHEEQLLHDRIAELEEENTQLAKLATQRGARMQILWQWMNSQVPDQRFETVRDQLLWGNHDLRRIASWFDEDGVPVE